MLSDDLVPMVHGLHALLPKLRAGQSGVLGSYTQPDVLTFKVEGQQVLVSDENGNERRYEVEALVDALTPCFDRLMLLLKRLVPLNPDWQAKLDRIKPAGASSAQGAPGPRSDPRLRRVKRWPAASSAVASLPSACLHSASRQSAHAPAGIFDHVARSIFSANRVSSMFWAKRDTLTYWS